MVPSVESDRAGGPWIELRGDWLHRVYIPECTLPLPFGYVGCVYHVRRPHLCGETLLSSIVRWPGLFLIIAMQPLFFVFGIHLAGLFEHPAFSVGVVGWFIRGAVDLTRAVEYAVQTGRSRIVSFEWLFPLTGLRATESCIDCRVFSVITIVATLVSVASGLAVAISGL